MRIFSFLFFDEVGGLGFTQASLVSACTDDTGDDGPDAVVKIKRLINKIGPDFCLITNWPFLRENLTYEINNAGGVSYVGAGYLPVTYRKLMGGHLVDQNEFYPLTEISIAEKHRKWVNPVNNSGRPDEFCVTRIDSGFWETEFNRLPDQLYTIDLDIEKQWVDLTETIDETVITKEYYTAFCHFLAMARFLQQGDTENYIIYKNEWWDPRNTINCILGRILNSLKGPMKSKRVIMREQYLFPGNRRFQDYNSRDYQRRKARFY